MAGSVLVLETRVQFVAVLARDVPHAMVPLVVFLVVPVLPVAARAWRNLLTPAAMALKPGPLSLLGRRWRRRRAGGCWTAAAGRWRRCRAWGRLAPALPAGGLVGVHDVRVCPRAREGLVGEEDVFREVPGTAACPGPRSRTDT